VPAENVLGEIGKGHKVAFNVLNFGRVKLVYIDPPYNTGQDFVSSRKFRGQVFCLEAL